MWKGMALFVVVEMGGIASQLLACYVLHGGVQSKGHTLSGPCVCKKRCGGGFQFGSQYDLRQGVAANFRL